MKRGWFVLGVGLALMSCGGDDHAAKTPPCCGGLCVDPHWSVSQDTCADENGVVTALGSEAGFLEVEYGQAAANAPPLSGRARVWYAFRPAEASPEQAPLVLIFQGGPGVAMGLLWGGNTGPVTLDPTRTGAGTTAANPDSWTRFANLLYVDAPVAGFSYFPDVAALQPTDTETDAAAFVRVLLRFLEHHPQLAKVPVVIAGESYGGLRESLMLQQLLHYPDLRTAGARFYDPALADEIESYLRKARASAPDETFAPTQVAATFAAQVALQGVTVTVPPALLTGRDSTGLTPDEQNQIPTIMQRVTDPATLRVLSGVDVDSIAWLKPSARTQAYACTEDPTLLPMVNLTSPPSLTTAWGALRESDSYYVTSCWLSSYSVTMLKYSSDDDLRFVDTLRYVDTFVSDSVMDTVVPTATALLQVLPTIPGIASVTPRDVDATTQDVDVVYVDGTMRTIRFPRYQQAYHAISVLEPTKLANDFETWLRQRGYVH